MEGAHTHHPFPLLLNAEMEVGRVVASDVVVARIKPILFLLLKNSNL